MSCPCTIGRKRSICSLLLDPGHHDVDPTVHKVYVHIARRLCVLG